MNVHTRTHKYICIHTFMFVLACVYACVCTCESAYHM